MADVTDATPPDRLCRRREPMTEAEFQVVKSIGFVAAFFVAVGLQRIRPHRRMPGSWRTNGALWAIDAVLLGVVCVGCACSVARWSGEAGIGLLNQAVAPAWLAILVSVLALDLVSYLWHRANHAASFLWRFHQAHHSDSDYTVTTALRFHPCELLLALPVRLVAIAALGVPIAGVIVFELVFAFANFWVHGNIGLPLPLERSLARLFVTPALHRRHHSREARQLDTNFGTIFTFWDRALRTYGDNRSDMRVDTGLPGVAPGLGTAQVLALPLRGVFRGG